MIKEACLPFFAKVFKLEPPVHWEVAEPNENCRHLTNLIIYEIYSEFNRLPVTLAASIEEGIYLRYSVDNVKEIIIEVDNDSDVVALINNNQDKKIVRSAELESIEQIKAFIRTTL